MKAAASRRAIVGSEIVRSCGPEDVVVTDHEVSTVTRLRRVDDG